MYADVEVDRLDSCDMLRQFAYETLIERFRDMTEKELIRNFVAAENLLIKTKPEYKQLDLKAIYDELFGEKPKANTASEAVHDHKKMEQELGYWGVKEAEDRFIKEEIERIKQHEARSRS